MTTPPPEPPAPLAGYPPDNGYEPTPGYPLDDPDHGYGLAPGYPPANGYEPASSQPSGPGDAADGYLDYPGAPGHPDRLGHPPDGFDPAGYPPMPDYPAADYPPMPDYPPTPDYPPASGHLSAPGYSPTPDYPSTPDYPRPRGYRAAPGAAGAAPVPPRYPVADYPRSGYPPGGPQLAELPPAGGSWVLEGAPVTDEEYAPHGDAPAVAVPTPPARAARADAPPVPAGAAPADAAHAAPATSPDGARWAMLAYLTVPFFGFLVPLAIYLMSRPRSRWLRAHAAQAVNVWLTGILYGLSALIIGAVLTLDSPHVALAVVVPLVIALWLTTLAFLVRAAARASRGETYTFPRWLCTPMVR